MRIGIDARFYGKEGKGLGRYTQKLIEYLERLDTENEYQIFLRRENFDEYLPRAGNFQKILADYQWYSFEEQWGFQRLLTKSRLDLMHFPHFNVPLLYRGKFVVTIHDLILLHFPTIRATMLNPFWYELKFLAYRLTIAWAIRKSERILTVSHFTQGDLERHYRGARGKITVTYEATEPFCYFQGRTAEEGVLTKLGFFSPRTTALSISDGRLPVVRGKPSREKFQRGILKPYLLYVGNAYPHKNLDALVRAAGALRARGVVLVVVGKDDYFYGRLKRKVARLEIENVFFTGFVPDADLDTLYHYARGYVFPSLYEGFGLPPLEAMAKGVPVLAARAGAVPEILGDAALYFDPEQPNSLKQSLLEFWENESLREAHRTKGYARVEGYSWERMAQETLEVYRSCFH